MIRTNGMVSARWRRATAALGLIGVFAALLLAPAAHAQQRRSILWLVDVADDSSVDRGVVIELFQELFVES